MTMMTTLDIYTLETHKIIVSNLHTTLAKQADITVRGTLNYRNNCRNTFGWFVGKCYKAKKLDILIISLVCRW